MKESHRDKIVVIGAGTVSYTHLDVYKRQAWIRYRDRYADLDRRRCVQCDLYKNSEGPVREGT